MKKFISIAFLLSLSSYAQEKNVHDIITVRCDLLDNDLSRSDEYFTYTREFDYSKVEEVEFRTLGKSDTRLEPQRIQSDKQQKNEKHKISIHGKKIQELFSRYKLPTQEFNHYNKDLVLGTTKEILPTYFTVANSNIDLSISVNVDPRKKIKPYSVPWYQEFFIDEKSKEYHDDENQFLGKQNLSFIWDNKKNRYLRTYCYYDFKNTLVHEEDWKKFGVSLPTPPDGEKWKSYDKTVDNSERVAGKSLKNAAKSAKKASSAVKKQ